jgi:hypothetical protein
MGNGIINSSVMVRKTALSVCGLFDENMPGNTIQDYDLWLRIARRFPLCYVAESLAVLRLHAEQGTWNRLAMLGAELQLMERILTKEEITQSPTLRGRMALLLESLGVAYLDSHDLHAARRCFAKAFRYQTSCRRAMLSLVSLLPRFCLDFIRNLRARLRVATS